MAINPNIFKRLNAPVAIAPLVHFRILFGLLMAISLVRFMLNGWIETQYANPTFHFSYYGFEWVTCPSRIVLYAMFVLMLIATINIILGLFYRVSALTFALLFFYVEFIDVTYYLNHYYFIILVALWMVVLPAHRYASLDVKLGLVKPKREVAFWQINILKLQLGIVYFYAGLAKLNPDWLFDAQPLAIWLSAKSHLPIIGSLLTEKWIHYFFSWFGAVYDLSIPFLMLYKPTRKLAYFFVVAFHLMTSLLFQIGVFPYVMIVATTIFFSEEWHVKLLQKWYKAEAVSADYQTPHKLWKYVLTLYVFWQLVFPFRFMLYPEKLFWTEQGYRFSWRVMLMEKAGYITFFIEDETSGNRVMVNNSDYLIPYQEKMMATQPDLILQFAHFLAEDYKNKGFSNPKVFAESYVALNGRPSKQFIDFNVNLAAQKEGWHHKTWILSED